MKIPATFHELPSWAWAAIGLGAAWLLLRPKEAGAAVGQGAANVATGLFTGLSEGILGLPQTNASKCAAAQAAGQTWSASLYCPAAEFIGYLFGGSQPAGIAAPLPGANADYTKTPDTTYDPRKPPVSVLDTGIMGPTFEDLSRCTLPGITCDQVGGADFNLGNWIDGANSQNRTLNPVNVTATAGLRG